MSTSPVALLAAQALSTLKEADAALAQAKRDAELAHSKASRESSQTLNQLRERFEEHAWGLACEEGVAPFSRSGSRLRHDNVSVEEEGIQLQWYADCGPDTWFLATWDALTAEAQHDN